MKTTGTSLALRKITLIAFGFILVHLPVHAREAAGSPDLQTRAEAKAPSLPVKTSFEKAPGSPYILKVSNESSAVLKVKGKVLLSVASHNMDKARIIPEHSIAAGETWTIGELAGDDKVILTADGFAPLELSVPFVK